MLELREDKKRRFREHRILLLGCGEAGKSTFIKQMRIIHSEGFSDEERVAMKADMAANVVSAIQTLLQNVKWQWAESSELWQAAQAVEGLSSRPRPEEVATHAAAIAMLWDSPPVQEAYARRNTFQIVECAKYFLSRVEQVMASEYVPNDQVRVVCGVPMSAFRLHSIDLLVVTGPGADAREDHGHHRARLRDEGQGRGRQEAHSGIEIVLCIK